MVKADAACLGFVDLLRHFRKVCSTSQDRPSVRRSHEAARGGWHRVSADHQGGVKLATCRTLRSAVCLQGQGCSLKDQWPLPALREKAVPVDSLKLEYRVPPRVPLMPSELPPPSAAAQSK